MSEFGGFDAATPSPQTVNQFHNNDDCDSSPFAHHHTIGTSDNQAASGKVVADLLVLVRELETRIEALEP